MVKIIGINSNVIGEVELTAGHAWLSLHYDNGRYTTVGLWTNSMFEMKRFVKDLSGFLLDERNDINFGLEMRKNYHAQASRYYALTRSQSEQYLRVFLEDPSWRYSNTCATWATRVIHELFHEDLKSAELMNYTNTPRALGNAILKLEKKFPTSLLQPRRG